MKKVLKRFIFLLCFAFVFSIVSCGGGNENEGSQSGGSSNTNGTESETEEVDNLLTNEKYLNRWLEDVSGNAEYNVKNEVSINTFSYLDETLLGGPLVETITINGVGDNAKLTTCGDGCGKICAQSDGMLIFKNVSFLDGATGRHTKFGGNQIGYMEFGGKLRFENCRFLSPVFLDEGTDAEFINCKFTSSTDDEYSLWIGSGNSVFKGCTFSGCRGIKIHETSEYDVKSVTFENCLFDNLTAKPGIAVGSILHDVDETYLTVKNCKFNNCQPWDKGGSIEGIDGFYELDYVYSKTETHPDGFPFIFEEIYINGQLQEEILPQYK